MATGTQRINLFSGKNLFFSAIIVALYWSTASFYNVYKTAAGGAVFEILWLPMLLLLCTTAGVAAFFWVKDKCPLRSLYLVSLLLTIGTFLLLLLVK